MIKISVISDEREGRRLATAIFRRFRVQARVVAQGGADADPQVVTDDQEVGGEQLRRMRRYADGWKDSLAEQR